MTDNLNLNGNSVYSRPKRHHTGAWGQLIGYQMNEDGERVRRYFSFGGDENLAIAQSVVKQQEWEEIVGSWAAQRPRYEAILPSYDWSKPIWPDSPLFKKLAVKVTTAVKLAEEAGRRADAATLHRINKQRPEMIDELRPKAVMPQGITVAQAREKYIAYRLQKVGLATSVGIKPATYNGTVKMLAAALKQPVLELSRPLASLTYGDIERFRDYWLGLPRDISPRTAANYVRQLREFLNWADLQGDIAFEMPRKAQLLFRLRGVKSQLVIEDYDPKKLGKILGHTERTKLYCLLGLNCGYYQGDIGDLRHDDLVQHKGAWCLWRGRSKTSHQNDFQTLHYLWPETYALIQKFKAKRNPHSRLLLNKDGLPVARETTEAKNDAIKDAMARMREATGVTFAFKQFRKIGWNAIKRIGGNSDIARMYANQTVHGTAKSYNKDDFGPLTQALKKWRKELKKDEVI